MTNKNTKIDIRSKRIPHPLSVEDSVLVKELEALGLTRNESTIYLYLLKRGKETGGSKISLGTYIHRQYVYVTLLSLITSGLVIKVEDGARHKYKAVSPSVLEKLARKKVDKASEVSQMLYKVSALDHEQEFEIYLGDQQVKEFERNFVKNLKENETQYIISGSSENFLNYFGPEYKEHTIIAKNKKLTSYYVGTREEESSLIEAKKQNPLFNYRILQGIPVGVTSTVVRMGTVTIYSLARPALIYIIKSKVVSEEYKKYFDVMWNMAKEG